MVHKELTEAWSEVIKLLQKRMSKYTYETFVNYINPLACYDSTIILEVPDSFRRDWLVDHYGPIIKQYLQQILKQEIGLKFTLKGEMPDVIPENKSNKLDQEDFLTPNTLISNKYTFDTFVVGNSNRFAHAACLAVSESPANSYNPLFIYGGVGLGKTHLMHAIAHVILKNNPQSKVAYLTSEKFTNELINAIQDKDPEEFRTRYRNMDVLLIDDIQFLAGKERTQEEFFHTFNTLYEANKQIIISSDRPPLEIPTLEDRLRSRFEWGLITDIQPPDYETRVAILRKKAQLDGLTIPDETILYIADKIQSNIRQLEGALTRVIAYANLNELEATPDLAANVLKDMINPTGPKIITVKLIQEVVSDYYKIRIEDLKAKKRTRAVAFPRQIAMYMCRELTDLSLPQIGKEFGGRDHTTVIHAHEKISTDLREDPSLQDVLKELNHRLKNA